MRAKRTFLAIFLSIFFVFNVATSDYPQKGNRPPRASSAEFVTILDRLNGAARLITAISLQNGLMDESIAAETALAELLNIGAVDFASLKTFDKAKVDSFVPSLNGLKGTLTASPKAQDLEKMVVLMESWREKNEKIGDLKDTKLAKEYFGIVEGVKGGSLNSRYFQSKSQAIGSFVSALTAINGIASGDTIDSQIHNPNLITLGNIVSFGENFGSDLLNWTSSPSQFDNLTHSNPLLHSPQAKFMDLLNDLEANKQSIQPSDPSAQTEIVTMGSSVNTALTGPDTRIVDIINLGEVVSSQTHRAPASSLKYTSGFANGYSDLKEIEQDAVNTELKSLLGGFSEKTVQSGLAPLKSLHDKISVVQQEWNPLKTAESVSTGKKFFLLTRWLGTLKTPLTEATVKSVATIGDQAPPSIDFSNNFHELLKKSVNLRGTLLNVGHKVHALQNSSLIGDLKALVGSMKGYLPTSKFDEAQVPQLITRFKEYKDSNQVLTTLNSLKSLVEGISTELAKLDVIQTIQALSGGQSTVDEFVRQADGFGYFKALNGVAKELKSVSDTVRLIQQIRVFPDDQPFIQQLSTMSTALSSSVPNITSVLGDTLAIKSNSAAEVVELKKLKDLGNPSKNFGDSVMALNHIKSAMNKMKDLKKFLTDAGEVENTISKLPDSTVKSELTQAWGDFGETQKTGIMAVNDVERGRNSIPTTAVSKFADFLPVFTAFAALPDVHLDFQNRQKVLQELRRTSQDMLNLKTVLDGLEGLDLEFAKSTAPLGQISTTLGDMDLAFVAALRPPPVQTPVPTVKTILAASTTVSQETTTAASSSGFEVWTIGVFVVVFCFVVAIVVAIYHFLVQPRFKKLPKIRFGKRSKSVDVEKAEKKNPAESTESTSPNAPAISTSSASTASSIASTSPATTPAETPVQQKKKQQPAPAMTPPPPPAPIPPAASPAPVAATEGAAAAPLVDPQEIERAQRVLRELEEQEREQQRERERRERERQQERREDQARRETPVPDRPRISDEMFVISDEENIRPAPDDPAGSIHQGQEPNQGWKFDTVQKIFVLQRSFFGVEFFRNIFQLLGWSFHKYLQVQIPLKYGTMKCNFYKEMVPTTREAGLVVTRVGDFNANFINCLTSIKFISSEAPNAYSLPEFLRTVFVHSGPHIVACGLRSRYEDYLDMKINEEATYEGLKVKLLNKEWSFGPYLLIRTFSMTDIKTGEIKSYTQWNLEWECLLFDNLLLEALAHVFQNVRRSEGYVFVFDSSRGDYTSSVFIGACAVFEAIICQKTPDLRHILRCLCDCRPKMVDRGYQIFAMVCVAFSWFVPITTRSGDLWALFVVQINELNVFEYIGDPDIQQREQYGTIYAADIAAGRAPIVYDLFAEAKDLQRRRENGEIL